MPSLINTAAVALLADLNKSFQEVASTLRIWGTKIEKLLKKLYQQKNLSTLTANSLLSELADRKLADLRARPTEDLLLERHPLELSLRAAKQAVQVVLINFEKL